MPNDCRNKLVVTDIFNEDWWSLHKSFKEEEFPANFVPEPDWENTPNLDGEVSTRDGEGFLHFPGGKTDERWYHWRCENWGTKWKVYGVEVEDKLSPEGIFEVFFSTAWAPINERCLSKVSKAFPSALFTLTYYEPNEGYLGATLAQGGVVVDMTRDASEARKLFEEANSETIAYYKTQYEDEEEFGDAVDDLWHDNEFDEIEKMESACVSLLQVSLENEIKRRKVMDKRIKDAVERLKNIGPGPKDKTE
jgi:hypothetical protein